MKNLNSLVVLAILLVVVWVIATLTRFIAGALLHLLLVVAVVLLLVWAVRKLF